MKKIFTLLTFAILSFGLAAHDAEARRFGGGQSIGKQREAMSQQAAPKPGQPPAAAPGQAAAGGSKWMGPLAGLAAGGLLAALFMGGAFEGILLNGAAYTHTSLALFDALKAVGLPCVEVHISNPEAREAYRHTSRIAPACIAKVSGFGADSYVLALEGLVRWLEKKKAR